VIKGVKIASAHQYNDYDEIEGKMCSYLDELTEGNARVADVDDPLQEIWIRQHAVLQAVIQEVFVVGQNVVDVFSFRQLLHEVMPDRLDDFDHHVVLEVLNGVHHPLTQCECRTVEL
jgi:hypothetical protein